MDSKSIEWVSYNKLSLLSDAFIYSSSLSPFISYKTGTPVSSVGLDNENYTAGSTNDPDDYSLPNIKTITNPEKLSKINPFYNNKINKITLLQYKKQAEDSEYPKNAEIEPEEKELEFDIHTSPEAKKMLLFLNKRNQQENKSESFELTFNDTEYEEFQLELFGRTMLVESDINENFSSVIHNQVPIRKIDRENISNNQTTLVNNYANNRQENISKSEINKSEIINKYNNQQNLTNINKSKIENNTTNNKFNQNNKSENNNNFNNTISNNFSEFKYQVYNNQSNNNNEYNFLNTNSFTNINDEQVIQNVVNQVVNNLQNNTINNLKDDITNTVNQVVNQMYTQITNEQNVDNKIVIMQEKIIEKVERTIIERESDLLEKLDKKSKENFDLFTKKILNS